MNYQEFKDRNQIRPEGDPCRRLRQPRVGCARGYGRPPACAAVAHGRPDPLHPKNSRQGSIMAEQDIRLDAWYFQCHMPGDPVQPGCLCVDAVWQLLGFYCVWRGALGTGRALGCGEVVFSGQIRPFNRWCGTRSMSGVFSI